MKTLWKRAASTVNVASVRVAGVTSAAKAMFVFAFLAACEGKLHEFGQAVVNADASAVVMGLDPVARVAPRAQAAQQPAAKGCLSVQATDPIRPAHPATTRAIAAPHALSVLD